MLVKMNSELSEIIYLDGFYSVPPSSMKTSYSVILKYFILIIAELHNLLAKSHAGYM